MPDGSLVAEPDPGRTAVRTQLSTGRRLGIMLAIVASFAVGAILGHNSVRTQPGTATAAPMTSIRQPAQSTVTGEPATGDTTAESEIPTRAPFADVTGPCGRQQYVAQIGYVSPLPEPIDMTIVAGSPPRVYDLSNGTVGLPLLQLPDDQQSVDAIVADGQGTVVAVRACIDPMSVKILRITHGGTVNPIEAPAGGYSEG